MFERSLNQCQSTDEAGAGIGPGVFDATHIVHVFVHITACGEAGGGNLFTIWIMSHRLFNSHRALPHNAQQFSLKPIAGMLLMIGMPLYALADAAAEMTPVAPENEVFVTATRSPQDARDVLADHVVISQEEIVQAGQSSLPELLQRKRGIEVTSNGGPGATSSVFIRGTTNEHVLVLLDGVRIGSSTLGGATWENIPLSQIDHIEIVYGPLSSMYGPDAVGGVIQIFSRRGDGAPHVSVNAGLGSYQTRKLDTSVAGAAGLGTTGSTVRYVLQYAQDRADGFSATLPSASPYAYNPDKDGYAKESALARVDLDWMSGHTVGLQLQRSRNNAQYDAGPGFDDRTVEVLENYKLYSNDRLTANWNSSVTVARAFDSDMITNNLYAPSSHYGTRQMQYQWQNDYVLGEGRVQWFIERREEKVKTDTDSLSGQRNTNAFGLSYQFKSGSHNALLSVRDDRSDQFGARATGGLAYGYRIDDAWRVSASYGTSFRAPTFNELYYPGYGIASNKPEQGKNAEVGIHYDAKIVQLDMRYFHNQVSDLLVYAPVCPVETASHPYGCAYNVDKALITGLSLGAKTTIGRWTGQLALDWQDPRDQTTDRILQRRAREHASASVQYRTDTWQATIEALVSGKRFEDTDNQSSLGGYGLVNLQGSYDLTRDWSVYARWNNIFNKPYELAKGYATPGSNVFVGVRYGFR